MTLIQHIDNNKIDENRLVMEEEFQHFVSIYLADSGRKLGLLDQAIQDDDLEAVIKLSHSLKGSASNMGAIHLSELCKAAEMKGRNDDIDDIETVYQQITKEFHVVKVLLSNMMF